MVFVTMTIEMKSEKKESVVKGIRLRPQTVNTWDQLKAAGVDVPTHLKRVVVAELERLTSEIAVKKSG